MNFFLKILSLLLLISNFACSQGKVVTHKVIQGETIDQISKKYKVTSQEIYKLNPDVQRGLKPYTVLLIPNQSKVKEITNVVPVKVPKNPLPVTHEVLPKETVYGILKKYSITEGDLMAANPFLSDAGLQIGQILTISTQKNSIQPTYTNKYPIHHTIEPKETKFSISRQYGLTIEDLEKLNPEILTSFPIGYKLLVRALDDKETSRNNHQLAIENKVLKNTFDKDLKSISKQDYEVQPQETIYGLSKRFNISQDELIALNPVLKEGVVSGMIIKVPQEREYLGVVRKEFGSLSKIIAEGKRKRLAILLPFNIPNIENDALNSTTNRLKKDKFLNMTLDFYSGVLVAIDSAKVLGLPIDVEIYDSQETKNSSSVATIIQKNKLQNANAVLGPFYQSNAEVAALLLKESNVPVISPLSKDIGNPYKNLFQTIPSPDCVKTTMFDFMRKNNGNIIAVVDPKKESIVTYIKEYQKGVPLVTFNSYGSVSSQNFKNLLVKGKKNFVVMETANTLMIKSTINLMLSAMKDYEVQLVVLDPNDALYGSEIKFDNLIKLRLMYPSVIRENTSNEALIFEKNYKKGNTIYPGAYATRGFDLTFDTMMRMVQDVKFEETVNIIATKQIDNQFEYYRKDDGGYTNRGVFILYYDSDLTIKEAK